MECGSIPILTTGVMGKCGVYNRMYTVPAGVHRAAMAACVPGEQGCIRREGTAEAAPEAVRQAVGGGCQSGWGRLLSVTNAIEAGTWRQGDSGWA